MNRESCERVGLSMTAFDHGGTVFAVARQLGVPPEELFDFSASINPLGPVPGVREALASAFGRSVHYPDSAATALTAALADYHDLTPANVCVGNGSTELIYLLPLLVAGRRGLIVAPPFSEYGKSLRRAGWEVDYLDLTAADGFRLAPAQLAGRLAAGYDLLLLGNPGNPSGTLLSRTEMAAIAELCRRHGTFLAIDEAFMDFCEEESAKGMLVERGGGVVLRSLTKFFAIPGLRLGYALGAPALIARLAALREPWSVNTLAQVAGLASLADPDYRRRTLALIDGERRWLTTALAALPGLCPYPAAANYLLVEIVAGPAAGVVARELLGERLLIRDCSSFRGLGERFFRVAVRSREENERLVAALGRLFSAGNGGGR